MTEQINIGIGIGHRNFFRLNIGTSDIGGLSRIGRTLVMLCAAKTQVVIKLLGQSGRIKSCSMSYLSLIFDYADSQAF